MLEEVTMTTRFYIEFGVIAKNFGTPEQLEGHLEYVADYLADSTGVIDPDLGANLETGEVEFSMAVDAETEAAAMEVCAAAVRSAIHAADGCTKGWEAHFEEIMHTVRRDQPIPV